MDEEQQTISSPAKPNRFHAALDSLLNKLICGERALFRKWKFWIALPIVYLVAVLIWPYGWMRWQETTRISTADIPGDACMVKYQPPRQAGFGRGGSLRTSGFDTFPTSGTGDAILADPQCLASVLKAMTYYEGEWRFGIRDSRTHKILFTIIKHPTPEGRPAHEGSVKKP